MRKITKSLLTLALLVFAVGGVNAKTLSVNLSALPASSESTTWAWDAGTSTGTFAWTATSYNSTQLFGAGDYSSYTTLNLVTTAGTANHFRIILQFSNGAAQVQINPVAAGTVSLTLTDYTTLENLAAISSIRLSGANDVTGEVTVSNIYLEGPDINYIEATDVLITDNAPAGTTDIKDLTGTNTSWSVTYPTVLSNATLLCGDGDGSNEATHVNIDGYDWLCFSVTGVTNSGQALRVWIWDDGTSSVKTFYAKPIANYLTANYSASTNVSAEGTYVVNISGYKFLKGIKTYYSDGTVTVSRAYLCKGETPVSASTGKYILVGTAPGSVTLTAALANPNATFFDATGVDGSGVDLTSVANPNALFKVSAAGVLSNTKNVIVGSTCANLVLTDGNYPFKTYSDFTATNVSYNRSFLDGKTATVCLPFALTEDDFKAINGGFYDLTGVSISGKDFTSSLVSAGTTAYRPYVFEPYDNVVPFEGFTNKLIPATPETLTGATFGGYTMTGVLTGSSDVAADNDGKIVYGWSGNDGNEGLLVKVGTGVAINPFRAYVVYEGAAPSPEMLYVHFDNDSVTGINEVSETKKALNRDGKFIKNGQIMIVKNGVKYNAVGAQVK